jgi:DNA-directed RNA polymerase subunit N (RpoN/RPB10)
MTAIGNIYRDYKAKILETKAQKQAWDEMLREYNIRTE